MGGKRGHAEHALHSAAGCLILDGRGRGLQVWYRVTGAAVLSLHGCMCMYKVLDLAVYVRVVRRRVIHYMSISSCLN